MKNIWFKLIILLIVPFSFIACEDDKNTDNNTPEQAPKEVQDVNNFIETTMTDVYLWYESLPDIDTRYEFDSSEYFEKLKHEDDRWSFVTDDVVALQNSFQGTEKTFGYSLTFGKFDKTETYFAIVEYVYPDSPAAAAGLTRGSIIVKIDGANITQENYRDLFYAETAVMTQGVYNAEKKEISESSAITLTAQTMDLDPVLMSNIIVQDDRSIGYLLYTQFIANYNSSLDNVIAQFVEAGVTDLVLDLRYNPGGGINAARHLCSLIAPANVVNNSATLVTYQWNDKYQRYYQSQKPDELIDTFESDVPTNMNLSKVYILTEEGTASASELTITGLKPYMDVVTIGKTTVGKYAASITIKPEHIYKNKRDYEHFKNWGIQPIVLRYANSQGVTDFKDGFAPNFEVPDNPLNGIALGDPNEPLLATAIQEITGTAATMAFKSAALPEYKFVGRMSSRFDKYKNTLRLDSNRFQTK